MSQIKDAIELTPADLEDFPVWEFIYDDELGESMVKPVLDLPLKDFDDHLIGTPVRLANGILVPSLIGNVHVGSAAKTREYMDTSIYHNGQWFHLARFRDVDIDRRGPAALAAFLNLDINDVFPISYDFRAYCTGDSPALAGTIDKELKKG